MSGYVPRRVLNARIGATIEKNQTPMQAGLAPRVGKSGASIRLYYQRVDGCCDFCDPEPIQILKRGIFPGDLVSGSWFATPGTASLNATSVLITNPPPTYTAEPVDRNAYYVIVFNRLPNSVIAVDPPAGTLLRFNTPTNVTWNNGIPGSALLHTKTIPSTDFKLLDFGNTTALAPNNTDIGKSTSGWQISLDGSTTTPYGPGQIPVGLGGLPGSWRGNSVNYNIGTGGLTVGISTAAGNMFTNNGTMSYLITNSIHFGGYAFVFNITRLLLASKDVITPPVSANWNGVSAINTIIKNGYRQGIANITWFNSNTPPNRNNIGIGYTPNEKTTLTNTDNCGFAAPIAPFKISVGDIVNPTNLPILTLIDSDAW